MKREGFEKTCRNEKDHKVRAKMVAVRMVLVLNTADAAPSRRAAERCKPTQVCPDNVAF